MRLKMHWTSKTGWLLGQLCAIGVAVLTYIETHSAAAALGVSFALALLVDIRDRLEQR